MPALLKITSSLPKLSSANFTIPSASEALEASAAKGRAFGPISFAVASAVSFFKSTTMTFAPSLAKRRQEALPMPEPPPVMRATLFSSRIFISPFTLHPSLFNSRHFKVSPSFPIGNHRVEFSLFGAEKVEVVIDYVLAEDFAREGTLGQRGDRFVERAGHVRQVGRGFVDVAFEGRRRLDVMGHAVQSRGDGGGEGEVDI